MAKRKSTLYLVFSLAFLFHSALQSPLFGWSSPILIINDSQYTYEKPQVQFSSSGAAYISYTATNAGSSTSNIFLSRLSGSSVEFVKNVSETGNHAYEGDVGVSPSGQIHVAWAEYSASDNKTQVIKYRNFSGSAWGSIQTLGQVTGQWLVEDLRLAVDSSNNVFVVFMVWDAGRCYFVSKYGSQVTFRTIPVSGRSKHPDVAVDNRYVYIAWQHLGSSDYTTMAQRKNNSASGSWLSAVDLNHLATQRPRTDADSSSNQHVVYWHDLGATRKLFYKYWQGSGFSSSQVVSDPSAYLTYHFADLDIEGANMIATMQEGGYYGGNAIYYNWAVNGVWGGLKMVPGTRSLQPAMASIDLTASGKAAVAVASSNRAVYVILSDGDAPEPPPPPPVNEPPTASFSFSPTSGLFPLTVSFNAGRSNDSDGTIVSYAWDFGDGGKGSGKNVSHVYDREGVYSMTLRVTDDDGATATATGQLEVFGIAPPLSLEFQRHENRNLFSVEYLYRLTWKHNPRNDDIGSKIAYYKIYRREVGRGGFAHFYTLPAGNYTEFEYLDRTLGRTARVYEYAVSSLDTVGRESTWAQ